MSYFIFTYFGRNIGESGESCNSIYSFVDACAECGTGANLKSRLITKKIGTSKSKLDFFSTLDDDFIISNELNKKLIDSNLLIGNLKHIVDYKGNDLPFLHLNPELTFPKADKINGLITENQCSVCKRNGYFNEIIIGNLEKKIPSKVIPVQLEYSKIDKHLLNSSDIFNSWECMGLSNSKKERNKIIRYARPLLIVSERFKKVIEDNNIINIKFESILINS